MGKHLGTDDSGKKEAGQQIEYTDEQIIELAKCANDFMYFTKYVTIATDKPTNPDFRVDLRDYQKEMAEMILQNRFTVILSSRQSGKCQSGLTTLLVRNKNNGCIEKINIGDLYKRFSQPSHLSNT